MLSNSVSRNRMAVYQYSGVGRPLAAEIKNPPLRPIENKTLIIYKRLKIENIITRKGNNHSPKSWWRQFCCGMTFAAEINIPPLRPIEKNACNLQDLQTAWDILKAKSKSKSLYTSVDVTVVLICPVAADTAIYSTLNSVTKHLDIEQLYDGLRQIHVNNRVIGYLAYT